MQDICDMLRNQQFRCYYSRIPMTFVPKSDWKCSIERLKNRLGYTKDNCVLICSEFNSMDNSIGAVNKVYGSAQMNRSKFQQILDKIQHLPALYDPKLSNFRLK
eukprot:508587_1